MLVAPVTKEVTPLCRCEVAVGDAARSRRPGGGIDAPHDAHARSEGPENVPSVRKEVNGSARVRSRQRRSDQFASSDVPQAQLAVVAHGHERPAAGAKGEGTHAAVVASERLPDPPRRPDAFEAMRRVEFPEHDPAGAVTDGDEP